MPIVHTADINKTRTVFKCLVLFCRCRRCELNCRQVKTVGDRNFRNWSCLVFLQFCPVSKCGSRQNCSVSNILRTTENCLGLSPIQFTPPTRTRQDRTVLSCPCRRCGLGIRWRRAAGNAWSPMVERCGHRITLAATMTMTGDGGSWNQWHAEHHVEYQADSVAPDHTGISITSTTNLKSVRSGDRTADTGGLGVMCSYREDQCDWCGGIEYRLKSTKLGYRKCWKCCVAAAGTWHSKHS